MSKRKLISNDVTPLKTDDAALIQLHDDLYEAVKTLLRVKTRLSEKRYSPSAKLKNHMSKALYNSFKSYLLLKREVTIGKLCMRVENEKVGSEDGEAQSRVT